MIKNKDIVCISVSDWFRPWGSKQRLMGQLAQHNRVLYVEHQGSFVDFIRYPKYFFNRLGKINKVRRIERNIYIYTPIPTFPFGKYSIFVNRINQAILCFILRRLIKKLKFKNPILWFYAPTSSDLIGKLGESFIIYHCAADFVHEKKNRLRRNTIRALEVHLIKHAHIVLTLTKDLCKRFKKLNENTFYFPSAVDMECFKVVREGNEKEPEDLSLARRPRLGVVGYLDGNVLNVDLLDYVAKVNSGWSVVMIGPLFRNVKPLARLKENKNVYFLGEKPPTAIPLYLKYFDVCLIPYTRNEFTNNVSPLKLYEYLAMGKPVVSTFFSDDLNDYKDIVGVADNKEQFSELVRAFLNYKDNEQGFTARINFASENSWQKRLDFLDEKIGDRLK
ncbi:MAG: glycosyltransferase [Candidatus Omnitrophica bacterium]|nr:glycosyltransferase [Candidatus Omnitrophota bacterium]